MATLIKRIRENSRVIRKEKDPRFLQFRAAAIDEWSEYTEEFKEDFDRAGILFLPSPHTFANLVDRLDSGPNGMVRYIAKHLREYERDERQAGRSEDQVSLQVALFTPLLCRWAYWATLIYRGEDSATALVDVLTREMGMHSAELRRSSVGDEAATTEVLAEAEKRGLQAKAIEDRQWGKLKTINPGEARVQYTPVGFTHVRGKELGEPAGGYVFVTEDAAYLAVETWSLNIDPGSSSPFLDEVRIPFSGATQVQVVNGTIYLWDDHNGATGGSPVSMDTIDIEVVKAIEARTSHLPADKRFVTDWREEPQPEDTALPNIAKLVSTKNVEGLHAAGLHRVADLVENGPSAKKQDTEQGPSKDHGTEGAREETHTLHWCPVESKNILTGPDSLCPACGTRIDA